MTLTKIQEYCQKILNICIQKFSHFQEYPGYFVGRIYLSLLVTYHGYSPTVHKFVEYLKFSRNPPSSEYKMGVLILS